MLQHEKVHATSAQHVYKQYLQRQLSAASECSNLAGQVDATRHGVAQVEVLLESVMHVQPALLVLGCKFHT